MLADARTFYFHDKNDAQAVREEKNRQAALPGAKKNTFGRFSRPEDADDGAFEARPKGKGKGGGMNMANRRKGLLKVANPALAGHMAPAAQRARERNYTVAAGYRPSFNGRSSVGGASSFGAGGGAGRPGEMMASPIGSTPGVGNHGGHLRASSPLDQGAYNQKVANQFKMNNQQVEGHFRQQQMNGGHSSSSSG